MRLVEDGRAAWRLRAVPLPRSRPGRRAAALGDAFVDAVVASGRFRPVAAADIVPRGRPGAERVPADLTLETTAGPGDELVLVARHVSGALSFHPGVPAAGGRRAWAGAGRARFALSVRTRQAPGERGIAGAVARVVVLELAGALADLALPRLASAWEAALWKRKRLERGLRRVTPEGLRGGRLERVGPATAFAAPPGRQLLFLHGLFSHARAAFGPLADTRGSEGRALLESLGDLYGGRVFAFDHLTVSESPEENARALVASLPERRLLFDVVTHSRGALVLRHLLEQGGGAGGRFELGRAVLVAAPHRGTPLASAPRWQELVGWIANLVDAIPGPFGLAMDFVTEGLAWLARRAMGSLPGLAAMAPESPALAGRNGAPAPGGECSALVANFEPEGKLLERLLDAGVDAFFGGANDLVVPTEGGWRTDDEGVPGDRIGCFGPGGNLPGAVHHLDFFSRPETVDFLTRALTGLAQPIAVLDPSRDLPGRRRGPARAGAPSLGAAPVPAARAPEAGVPGLALPSPAAPSADNILSLFVVSSGGSPDRAELLATFRNARVLETFERKGDHWQTIIGIQRAIRGYIDGSPGIRSLPGEAKMRALGEALFETLFPGRVRRLYDVARSLRGLSRLDIVLTSMIDWVADNPWELAYDPGRRAFLATEEVNFVRNVLTAVPAEEVESRGEPLRILVAAAQPLGAAPLSAEEEAQLIRRGFADLEQAGLARVTVMPAATPELLHRQIQATRFDVLHFIGHGEYDAEAREGYLLFEDAAGGAGRVDAESVRQIVGRRGIRLVFLNACETGAGGRADFNRGVAPALVAAGVPAVVANQYKVLDFSATTFAQHFYWALAQGRSVGDAAHEARIAVNYSVLGPSIDWAVPVVYARNPLESLCRPVPQARIEAVTTLARARRRALRAASQAAVRVGLWDVNQAVPSLERVAETLNRVQDVFAFEVADVTAPLGTWRLEREGDSGEGFLHGGHLRDRLRSKPAELGVSRLFCVTAFRLGDDRSRNLYIWDERVPGGGESRLSIFSLHGWLRQLRPPGLTLERALANALAGCLSEVVEHHGPPRTCPLYFNKERRLETIAGPLAFDRRCRRRVVEVTSRRHLAALEAILRAFA